MRTRLSGCGGRIVPRVVCAVCWPCVIAVRLRRQIGRTRAALSIEAIYGTPSVVAKYRAAWRISEGPRITDLHRNPFASNQPRTDGIVVSDGQVRLSAEGHSGLRRDQATTHSRGR